MGDTVLIAGGAGYVGSHCAKSFAQRGYNVVVVDNLANGHDQFVRWGPLHIADIRNRKAIADIFLECKPKIVVHCAALIEVEESQSKTIDYYDCNVSGSINLIQAAEQFGVEAFVFSSTCAVYGRPQMSVLTEEHPLAPVSPYGRTKLLVENILADMRTFKKFPATSLRYFNAGGSAWKDRIGEHHQPETHAIPLAIRAALNRNLPFTVFGTDYPTEDGSAVRDYVHVEDLADAHVRAAEYMVAGNAGTVFNLGTGRGNSVRQLVDAVSRRSGQNLAVEIAGRRPGDPERLIADNTKAKSILGWSPERSFDDIIESAWRWHSCVQPELFSSKILAPLA